MLDALAQTTYTYTTTEVNNGTAAGLALFSGVFLIIWLAVAAVMIISMWKIFEKAGVEGWKAIIPVYNGWVLAEIAGKPGWWALVGLGAIIPLLGIFAGIAAFVLYVLIAIELAKAFGKDTVYAVLLILVPVVGFPILAFSDAKYTKPATPKKA